MRPLFILQVFGYSLAPLVFATTALALSERRDSLECFRIRDSGARAVAPGPALIDQIPAGCRLRERAALVCSPASASVHGESETGAARAQELVFDQLCYEVRCDRDAREDANRLDAREEIATDRTGARAVRRGRPTLICTPATLALLDEQSSQDDAAGSASAVAGQLTANGGAIVCGDFTQDGGLSATDALGTLRAAVGSATCLPCICDVDGNGILAATDALATLKKAVGQAITLNCQADGNPVSWTGNGDGASWHVAANWSSSPRIPNLCDDVSINVPGITVVHSQGTSGVRRLVSQASLNLSGGTLRARETVQVIATLRLLGGTLRDATVLAPDGSFVTGVAGALDAEVALTPSGGLLDGVTMEADMNLTASSANVRIQNDLVLNGTATMGSNANLRFQGGTQTLEGTGEVVFSGTGNKTIVVDNATTLTIPSGMIIRGATGTVGSTGALVNQGLIDSDQTGEINVSSNQGWTNEGTIRGRLGGDIQLNDTWTNNGEISIADSGVLTLEGNWNNAGTITSVDSTVNLGGNFTLAALGQFDRTGGTVNLTGDFNNATNLLLDAATGSWNLVGGTVLGGSISTADGAQFVMTPSGGLLDGVTMEADMNLTASSANVRIQNDLVLNGTATMGSNANLRFQGGTQTLEGTGEVVFSGTGNKTIVVDNATTLTIPSGMIIRGATGTVGSTGALVNQGLIDSDQTGEINVSSNQGWTNEGTIRGRLGGDIQLNDTWTNNGEISIADSGVLTLEGNWNNAGTITSVDSTVNLGGNFTLAALGQFDRTGGTVNLTGDFNNATNLLLDAATGSWNLVGGTVLGGSISTADGAQFVMTPSGGLLDGVTMEADMNLTASSANVRIQNDLVLNGTATMGSNANLRFQGGTQTLEGTGEVVFSGTGNKTIVVDNATTLTIPSGMIIRGATGTVGSTGALVNQGLIDSDQTGTITIAGTQGWTNSGTLRASGGDLRTTGTGTHSGTIELGAGLTLTAATGFTQSGAGTLSIDIGGSTSFGEVAVTGAASLAGTLTINLTNGFDPAIGETFTVMTFTSRSGDFSTVNGLDIGGGKLLQRSFTATSMVLEVVSQ